jgi:hypothetical protein
MKTLLRKVCFVTDAGVLDPIGTNLADGFGFNQSRRYLTAPLIVKAGSTARSS